MAGGSSLTDFDFERIGVASALTFLVGIIQVVKKYLIAYFKFFKEFIY